jgi:hypothetical protein
MSTSEVPPESSARAEEAPPVNRLEDAIRQIVREELNSPTKIESSEASRPTWKDAFWLAIFVIDVGLLLWWIPGSLLKDEHLDFLTKLVPWLGSYLFVLGYSWFRERILVFSRTKLFKGTLIALLVLLIPLYGSQMRLFHVSPRVEPKEETILKIDNETEKDPENIWQSLRRHDVTVTDSAGKNERKFVLGFGDIFRSLMDSSYRPRWPLLYEVLIATQDPEAEVIIEKTDSEFDRDFVNQQVFSKTGLPLKFAGDRKLTLHFIAPENQVGDTDTLRLPYGIYKMIARKESCGSIEKENIQVGTGQKSAGFVCEKPLCKQKH